MISAVVSVRLGCRTNSTSGQTANCKDQQQRRATTRPCHFISTKLIPCHDFDFALHLGAWRGYRRSRLGFINHTSSLFRRQMLTTRYRACPPLCPRWRRWINRVRAHLPVPLAHELASIRFHFIIRLCKQKLVFRKTSRPHYERGNMQS